MSEEPKTNRTLVLLLKQAQTILAFGYLSMVAIGMIYYSAKYSEFGINIFQYASILYFLVAPFEDVFILRLCGIVFALSIVAYVLDRFLEQKYPRFYKIQSLGTSDMPFFQQTKPLTWVFLAFALLLYYATIYGEKTKERILKSDPITLTYADETQANGQLIGKTDDTIFMIIDRSIKAIPINSSVKELTLARLDDVTAPADPGASQDSNDASDANGAE